MLTQDELDTLRNVDSKKIKLAGEDFLNQLSPNRKKLPEEISKYVEKLNKIVEKIEGTSEKPLKQSLESFVSGLGKPNTEVKTVAKEAGNAVQNAVEVLKPLKVFHNTRIALSQLSVWVLAVAIIPPLCNAVIAPIMKKFSPKNDNVADKKSVEQKPLNPKPVVQSYNTVLQNNETFNSFRGSFTNYSIGMRV